VKSQTTAREYARGFLAAAVEHWTKSFSELSDKLESNLALQQLTSGLDSRPFAEKQHALSELITGDLSKLELDFINVLLSHGDLSALRDVAAELTGVLHGESLSSRVAEITTAQPLADDERNAIEQKLAGEFGSSLQYNYIVDSAILGGLVIRIGDKLIDSSVATRLNRMREQLAMAAQ